MEFESLIGFGIVFVLIAWAVSSLLTLAIWLHRGYLRGLGPATERRAIELAVVLPIGFALAIVGILMLRSLFGFDHCQAHDHHAHLCLTHGAAWGREWWAVSVVAVAATVTAIRLGLLIKSVLQQRRLIDQLRGFAWHQDGVWWVDSAEALCFATGFRAPQIFISTGVWSVLDEVERLAVLAHERTHVSNRDIARRFVLDVLLLVGAPLGWILRRGWSSATERLCDARAAIEVGHGDIVASAIMKVSRLGTSCTYSFAGFTPPADVLTDRIEAVLEEAPAGDAAAHMLSALVGIVCVIFVTAFALESEPLHHVLESLLG